MDLISWLVGKTINRLTGNEINETFNPYFSLQNVKAQGDVFCFVQEAVLT